MAKPHAPNQPAPDRLSRDERRAHLLDVAAELVLAGELPLSMEAIARAAGVSKTLPYKHFDNVGALVGELFHRESLLIAGMIWQALQDAEPGDDLARVWVGAYFDALSTHGAVLQRLHTPGSEIAMLADPEGRGPEAVALVLRDVLGVERQRASEVSRMIHGGIVGAALSWVNGEASRDHLERYLVDLIRAVMTQA